MSLRYPVAIMFACMVTLFLFWVMQALVNTTGELTKGIRTPSVDFVRLRKDTTPPTKKRAPPKKQKPDAPPPPPDIAMSKAKLDTSNAAGSIAPMINPTDALAGGIQSGGGSDREIAPLVRIPAEYPMRARQRRIEGWVHVSFTVTKIGSVRDVVVVDSHPGTIFDKAAVRSVEKWKYNPKIENGVAKEMTGVTTIVDFKME